MIRVAGSSGVVRGISCRPLILLYFSKQKTAYEMRISDGSSDVCSSDLQFVGDQMLLAVAGDDADRAYPDLGDPPDIGHAAQRRNAHRGGVADDEHVARLDRAVHQQDDPRDQIADRLLQPETDGEDRKSTRLHSRP